MRVQQPVNYYNKQVFRNNAKKGINTQSQPQNNQQQQTPDKTRSSGVSKAIVGILMATSMAGGYTVGNYVSDKENQELLQNKMERTDMNGYKDSEGNILSFEEAKDLTNIPPRKAQRYYIKNDTITDGDKTYIHERKYEVKEYGNNVETKVYDAENNKLIQVSTYDDYYAFPRKRVTKDPEGNIIESREYKEFSDEYACPSKATFILDGEKTRTDVVYQVACTTSKGPKAEAETATEEHTKTKTRTKQSNSANKPSKKTTSHKETPQWEKDLQQILQDMTNE